MSDAQPQPNYWDYLRLDKLLALQGGLEGDDAALEPDELHFIVVHQAFELWFKLVLRELRLARDLLGQPRVAEEAIPHVVHHLGRINAILRLCIDQFGIMETLTPQDFLAFRDKLIPASGFQSFQMREIELLLGLEDRSRHVEGGLDVMKVLERMSKGSPGGGHAWGRVESARKETTLLAGLRGWLFRTPIDGSSPGDAGDAQAVTRFCERYLRALEGSHDDDATRFAQAMPEAAGAGASIAQGASAARAFLFAHDAPDAERARTQRIRAGLLFVESYRTLPLLAWPRVLVDAVVELEEQLVLWRTRHARMVERVIGRRIGTGGSSGVDYLDQTARYRIFTELWAVRTILLPKAALPPLSHPEAYGFVR